MFAVIRTGGKQYRVSADDIVDIEKVAGSTGDPVVFGEVLMVGGDHSQVGAPLVEGASVAAEILEQGRGRKVIVFKKRRRKNSRRKNGHRQFFTRVRITDILTEGKKPPARRAAKAAPKAEAPKAAETADEASAAPAKAKSETAAPPQAKAAAKAGDTPQALFAAPEGPPDDLKKISGVGPVIERKLRSLGVTRYEQLAGFTAEDIARVDDALNFKGRIERDDWVGQARELADAKKET